MHELQCWHVPHEGWWRHRGRLLLEREWSFAADLCVCTCRLTLRIWHVRSVRMDRSQLVERPCAQIAVLASTWRRQTEAQRQTRARAWVATCKLSVCKRNVFVHIVVVHIRWMQDAFLYYTDALSKSASVAWASFLGLGRVSERELIVHAWGLFVASMPFCVRQSHFKHLIALISRTRGSSVKISPTDWLGEVELVLNITIPCWRLHVFSARTDHSRPVERMCAQIAVLASTSRRLMEAQRQTRAHAWVDILCANTWYFQILLLKLVVCICSVRVGCSLVVERLCARLAVPASTWRGQTEAQKKGHASTWAPVGLLYACIWWLQACIIMFLYSLWSEQKVHPPLRWPAKTDRQIADWCTSRQMAQFSVLV